MKPEERVKACLDMYDFARSIVESSLPEGMDEISRKRAICERFYGADLASRVFPR